MARFGPYNDAYDCGFRYIALDHKILKVAWNRPDRALYVRFYFLSHSFITVCPTLLCISKVSAPKDTTEIKMRLD